MRTAAHLDLLTAAAWPAHDRARVLARGADARSFLHRLSTNHVADLGAGQGRLNALLTDKGRIVDLVHHLDRGDAGVLLVGGRGRGAALLAWLDRFLFTEDVALADLGADGGCVEVAGARAAALVEGLVTGAGALSRWAFLEQDGRLVVRAFDRVDEQGSRVPGFFVVDLAGGGALDALVAAGARLIDGPTAEALRVAAGVPGEAGELTDAYHPLELALHDAIHWAKGCYIGQEVIARLDSYAKVGRELVGLTLDDAALARVTPGDAVQLEGRDVGAVTSVSPLHNGALPSALAVIARGHVGGAALVRGAPAVIVARAVAQAPHE